MKKLMTLIGATGFIFANAQETQTTKLENLYKVEVGIQGVSAGTELPISNKFLGDLGIGWGGLYDFQDGISYAWGGGKSTLFLRGQLRYYLNRDRRQAKGHSLQSNSGTFLALQTKFLPLQNSYHFYKSETNWLNEVQFGQQLPLGQHLLFRYQIGVGFGTKTDYHHTDTYPALGATLGYRF